MKSWATKTSSSVHPEAIVRGDAKTELADQNKSFTNLVWWYRASVQKRSSEEKKTPEHEPTRHPETWGDTLRKSDRNFLLGAFSRIASSFRVGWVWKTGDIESSLKARLDLRCFAQGQG